MYKLTPTLFFVFLISTLATALSLPTSKRALQPLPLSRDGRWITDANGAHVPYVGINWPGAGEVMIPEGLQYQSISNIVSKIADMGFNVVRLTFAIEMVDNIVEGGSDVGIGEAFKRALGTENGTLVLGQVLEKNPVFTGETTRLQVFDAVAKELAAQNIYLHLDNHVSKGMWCCSLTDGNSWFGDTWFDTVKWTRGLTFMAEHGKTNWPTFTSLGLRNELRPSTLALTTLASYTWSTWKSNMINAANLVHESNPSLLIFFSGLDSDFNIQPLASGSTVLDSNFNLDVASYSWSNKFVLEIHEYDENISGSCFVYKGILDTFGFDVVKKNTGNSPAPLVVSEWGRSMNDDSGEWKGGFATCLAGFMVERKLGWMVWVLAGSYYTRQGERDKDESYGLLDHTWSNYRGVDSSGAIRKLVQDTYAAYA